MSRRVLMVFLVVSAGLGLAGTSAAPSAADGNEAPGAPIAFRSITAGYRHTCALLGGGSVKCWGRNANGQLGLGDQPARGDEPNEMGADLVTVDLGTGRTATAISAGNDHTCALLDDATVKCWGYNGGGQLGLGNTAPRGDGPGEMGDNLPPVDLGTGRTANAISAGDGYTCALLDNATVKCWGANNNGQLGLGNTAPRGDGPGEMGDNLPPVDLGTGRTATAIAAGGFHTCALLDNATVKCWGYNSSGELGLEGTTTRGDSGGEMGNSLPAVSLGNGRTATAVVAGTFHTCALLDDATVKCWGYNASGRLGLGDTNNRGDSPNPGHQMGNNLPAVDLGTGRTATAVTAGDTHTCALLDNATVKCWGFNNSGQLGLGSTISKGDNAGEMGDNLPAVDLGTGRTAIAVTTGAEHTCAVLDDTALKCWGLNVNGQLGLGSTDPRGDQPNELGDALPAVALNGSGIAGLVTGSTGPALGYSLVAVLDPADFSIVAGTQATSDGRFSVAVASGQYFVYAIEPTGSFVPGFAGAPTLVPVAGGTPSPATATLAPTTGDITGTVTETGSGTPVGGAYVQVLNGTTGAPEKGAVADSAGQFTVSGLRPGPHYVLYVDPLGAHPPRYHPSSVGIGGATPVILAAGQVATADGSVPAQAPIGTSTSLTGRVTETGSDLRLAGILVLALRAGDYTFARAGVTNSTGGYALTVTPGDYLLAFVDPTGHHTGAWFSQQPIANLTAATPVTAPGVANPALEPTTGAVSGTVTGPGGGGVDKAWVIAVRAAGVAGAAVAATDGTYALAGLPPDNYRAAILDPASGAFEYWSDAASYPEASTFVVAAGGDTPIDATLGP